MQSGESYLAKTMQSTIPCYTASEPCRSVKDWEQIPQDISFDAFSILRILPRISQVVIGLDSDKQIAYSHLRSVDLVASVQRTVRFAIVLFLIGSS